MPSLKFAMPAYYVLATTEASTNLARYSGMLFGVPENEYHQHFNDYFSGVRTDCFGEEAKRRILLGTFCRMVGFRDKYYLKALSVRHSIIHEYESVFKHHAFVASPTMPIVAPRFEDIRSMKPVEIYLTDFLTLPPNLTGLPHISMPCGYVGHMPVGMQLVRPPLGGRVAGPFRQGLGEGLQVQGPGGGSMKIGLEMHFTLPTRSSCSVPAPPTERNRTPRSCPTCLGFPGSRPSLNRKALEYGLMVTKFLNCQVNEKIWFSRKTYFYPDLPKHFQITQYESPLGVNGHFDLNGKRIGIWRVHIEEDPGRIKRVGRSGEEVSLVDYNRSGVPLVEIVTAPDLSSPAEAREFIDNLRTELRHLVGISAQEDQSIRVDCNISVGEERVEVKNVQGLRNIEQALKYEVTRQTKMLEAGKKIVRETRRYEEERKVTSPAREKEFEEDYGYIGEPDLGEYNIGQMFSGLVLPETPLMRAERMAKQCSIPEAQARQLVLTSMGLADLFEEVCGSVPSEKAVQWLLGPVNSNWAKFEPILPQRKDEIVEIIKAMRPDASTTNEAKMRLLAMVGMADVPSVQEGGQSDIEPLVNQFLDKHPEVVKDYRTNPKAANSVIGFVMKETKGRYSSKEIVECVNKEIEKRV